MFCPAIVFPTVARGKARVRTIVTADHTEEDLREALDAFERVGSRAGAHRVTDVRRPTVARRAPRAAAVLPLVEVDDAAQAVALARVLVDSGLPVMEVALRTHGGAGRDRRRADRRSPTPSSAWGRSSTPAQLSDALGGRRGVRGKPGIERRAACAAAVTAVPFVPGVATVTELMRVVASGIREVKFFPAEASGGRRPRCRRWPRWCRRSGSSRPEGSMPTRRARLPGARPRLRRRRELGVPGRR